MALRLSSPALAPREMIDHQPAVQALDALRLDLDLERPEPDQLTGPLARSLGASSSSGDHLRIAEPPEYAGHEMAAALARILSTDVSTGISSSEAAVKEAKMRRVLEALAAMNA